MSCSDDLRDLKEVVVKKGDLKPEDLQDMEPGTVVIFPGPKWTSDKPTKPGWYWYRGSFVLEDDGMEVVHVYVDDDGLCAETVNNFAESVNDFDGEWCGPLEMPTT